MLAVGERVGLNVGTSVGAALGLVVGAKLGAWLGLAVGALLGALVGGSLGLNVGSKVGDAVLLVLPALHTPGRANTSDGDSTAPTSCSAQQGCSDTKHKFSPAA